MFYYRFCFPRAVAQPLLFHCLRSSDRLYIFRPRSKRHRGSSGHDRSDHSSGVNRSLMIQRPQPLKKKHSGHPTAFNTTNSGVFANTMCETHFGAYRTDTDKLLYIAHCALYFSLLLRELLRARSGCWVLRWPSGIPTPLLLLPSTTHCTLVTPTIFPESAKCVCVN